MRVKHKYIGLLSGLLVLVSCGKKLFNDAGRYIAYIDDPENGLIQQQAKDNIKFVAALRPSAYMAIKELGEKLDASTLKKRSEEMGNNLVLTFRIMSQDGSQDAVRGQVSPQEYLQRITHMTGPIQNDFFLIQGTDTVPCAFSHFERAYNVTPYNEIMLGFEAGMRGGNDKELLYHDQLFGLGYIKFSFSSSDIKRIPQLTL